MESFKFKCPKCDYCTDKLFNYNRHIKSSVHAEKNTNTSLNCQYCNKQFANKSNKTRHEKTCKLNPGHITQKSPKNTSILTFNINEIEFHTHHIDIKEFENEFKKKYTIKIDFMKEIIKEYSRQIFKNDDNKCVIKTSKTSSYSLIHIGDNKWKTELDKRIYPRLATIMANSLQEYLLQNSAELKSRTNRFIKDDLSPFLDSMADEGYSSNDDKFLRQAFKMLSSEMKLILWDAR